MSDLTSSNIGHVAMAGNLLEMWLFHLFSGWECLRWKRLDEFICLSDHPCGSHLCTLFIMARRGPRTSYPLTPK